MLTINALCGKRRCSGEEYINEYQLCYALWEKQLEGLIHRSYHEVEGLGSDMGK